jgi:AraC family ethanolamine operon transcriptional activator
MEEKQPIFISQIFENADLMAFSSTNWKYDTVYRLLPNAFKGKNTVIILPSLQLSYAQRSGGILYNVVAPKGMLSIGIVTRADGKACFGRTKLKKGDILFFDDKHANSLVTSDAFEALIISIPRKSHKKLTQKISSYLGKVMTEKEDTLSRTIRQVLERFEQDAKIRADLKAQQEIEATVITRLENLLKNGVPYIPKLTKGEKIALEIRDRIYKKVTKKVTITSLASEFGVSEQTLQNAFKSLFGLTPNKFLRNLKLNHVRKALVHASAENETIVHIANKWGFTHMGHFSRYFTDLFGENPSVTLNKKPPQEDAS